jgi:hypothetical protein
MSSAASTSKDIPWVPIIIFIVFSVLLTIVFYYIAYRVYNSGQKTCEQLYPGNTLKAKRLQEDCKDRKRKNWALPAAAMIFSSND